MEFYWLQCGPILSDIVMALIGMALIVEEDVLGLQHWDVLAWSPVFAALTASTVWALAGWAMLTTILAQIAITLDRTQGWCKGMSLVRDITSPSFSRPLMPSSLLPTLTNNTTCSRWLISGIVDSVHYSKVKKKRRLGCLVILWAATLPLCLWLLFRKTKQYAFTLVSGLAG